MPSLFNIISSGVLSDNLTFGRAFTGTDAILEAQTAAVPLSTSYRRLGNFTLAVAESGTFATGLYINLKNIKPTSTLTLFLSSNGGTSSTNEYVLSSIPALSTYSESFYIGLMFDPIKFNAVGTTLVINVSARTSELSGAFYIGTAPAAATPTVGGVFNKALISTATLPISSTLVLTTDNINVISHLYSKQSTTYGELSGSGSSNVVKISGARCSAKTTIECHGDSSIEVVNIQGGSLDSSSANILQFNNSSSFIAGTYSSPLTSNFTVVLSGVGGRNITLNHSSNFVVVGDDKLNYTYLLEDTLPNISSISLTNFNDNLSQWAVGDTIYFPPNGKLNAKGVATENHNEVTNGLRKIVSKNNNAIQLNSKIPASKLSLSTSIYGPDFRGAPVINLNKKITFGPFIDNTYLDAMLYAKDSSKVYIKNAEICRTHISTIGEVIFENNVFRGTSAGSNPIQYATFIDTAKALNVTWKNNISFSVNTPIYSNTEQTAKGVIKNLTIDGNIFMVTASHPINVGNSWGNPNKSEIGLTITNNTFCSTYVVPLINTSSYISTFRNNISYYVKGGGITLVTKPNESPAYIQNYKAYKILDTIGPHYPYGIRYCPVNWADASQASTSPAISCKDVSIVDSMDWAVYTGSQSFFGIIDGLTARDCNKGVYIKTTEGPVNIANAFIMRNNKTSKATTSSIDGLSPTIHTSTNLVYDVKDCEFTHSIRNSIVGSSEDAYAITLNNSNFLDKLKIDYCDLYSSKINLFLCPLGYPNHKSLVRGNILCSNTNFYYPKTFTFASEVNYIPETDGGSVAFDGENYIKPLSGSHFNFGSGDFTIDGWVNATDTTVLPIIFDTRTLTPSKTGFAFGLDRSWFLELKIGNNSYKSNKGIFAGLWYHIALSKTSGVYTMWVNGEKVGSFNDSTAFDSEEATLGASFEGENIFTGNIFNFRVIKGESIYDINQNFDPPSYPVSSTNNTSLLLGAYKHNQVVDRLGKNEVISYSTAMSSRKESKFGTSSIYFDGANYGALGFRKSDNFSFGTSNFTIEGWLSSGKTFESVDVEVPAEDGTVSTTTVVSEVTASSRCIFDTRTSGSSTSGFYLAEHDGGFIVGNDDTTFISTESGRESGKWQHFAVVRDGSKLTLFIDGLSSNGGSFDLTTENFSDSNLTVGGYVDNRLNPDTLFGYLDNFLVIKDEAKYTRDFNPSPLLLNDIDSSFAGLNKSKLVDNSVNNALITPSLPVNTIVRSASPKSDSVDLYNESLHYGGLYFDSAATQTSIEIPYKPELFDWWSSDFTLEYFIYPTTFNEIATIADTDFTALGTNRKASLVIGNFLKDGTEFVWSFGHLADATAAFVYQSVNAGTQQPQRVSSSEKLSAYSWNHVALVKNSSGIRIYVNGIGNTLSAVQFSPSSNSSIPLTIGQHNNTKIADGTIISNLRIVKGTALYSGDTINVPTSALINVANTSLLLKATNGGIIDGSGNTSLLLDGTAIRNLVIDTSKTTYGTNVPIKNTKAYAVYNRILDAKGSDIITFGNANVELISPFNESNPYNVSTHGGSVAFNINAVAANDSIISQQTEATNFGTENFVVDFFVYPTTLTLATLFTIQSAINTSTGFRVETNNTGQIKFHSGGVDKTSFTNSAANITPLSTWTHIAVSRTGNQLKIYKNGTALPSFWTLTNENFTDSYLRIGTNNVPNNHFRGYISNFRIRKGVGESVIASTIPTAPLPDTTECDLLINTFYPDPIVQSTYSPLTSNIVYFDGNSFINAYQERPSIKIGPTDPLTIQMWVKFDDITNQRTLIDTRSNLADSSKFILEKNAAHKIALRYTTPATRNIVSNSVVSTNIWYHIAVVIDEQKTVSLYINGLLEISGIDGTQDLLETFPFKIGAAVDGTTIFKGHISNLRITKKAEYSGNFIPPTEDILDVNSDTLFLLNHRTDSQKYYAVDKTGNTTFSNMYGSVAGVSGRFSDNSGIRIKNSMLMTNDYLSAYDLGADNATSPMQQFCLEFWFYNSEALNGTFKTLFQKNGGANSVWTTTGSEVYIFLQNNSVGILYNNGNSTTPTIIGKIINNATLPLNTTISSYTWNHFAFTCDGNTYRGYLNGTMFGSSTVKMLKQTSPQTSLGFGSHVPVGITANQFDGVMSDIRLTKGAARYTGNTYTVPSAPFDLNSDPDASKVVMLVKSENSKSYRINDIIDSSSNNNQIFGGSGVSQIKSTPVNPNGWCVYFDGTDNSKITIPANNAYKFDTLEFTVELWFYKFKSKYYPTPLNCLIDYTTNLGDGLKIGLSGANLMISGLPSSNKTLSNFGEYIEDAWNHVAVVNTGAVLKVFLNGEQRNGDIDVQTSSYTQDSFVIGANRATTTTEEFCGLISNLRVVKGTPLYVTNFTPNKNELPATVPSDLDPIKAKLLLNGDTTSITNGDVILDLSNKNLTLTKMLTVYKSDSNPFGGGDSDVVSKPFNTTEHQTDVFREKGIVNSYIGGNPKKHGKYLNSGTIITDDTVFRNVAVGFSEKLTPNSNKTRLRSSSRLVALRAYNQMGNFAPDTLSKISVWVRKSSDWSGQAPRLIVVENKSMGVFEDTVLATATQANDTWIKLEATNIGSVKKTGMLEFYVDCVGVNVGSIWIDDWSQEII